MSLHTHTGTERKPDGAQGGWWGEGGEKFSLRETKLQLQLKHVSPPRLKEGSLHRVWPWPSWGGIYDEDLPPSPFLLLRPPEKPPHAWLANFCFLERV